MTPVNGLLAGASLYPAAPYLVQHSGVKGEFLFIVGNNLGNSRVD